MASAPSQYDGTMPVAAVEGLRGGVTLISGRSFALSDSDGNMQPSLTQGLFVLDTRVLSRWVLTLDGEPVEVLGVDSPVPFRVTFVGRGRPVHGHADADVVVQRKRSFDMGMHEEIIVTNHGLQPVELDLGLQVDCDFAGLFEVKESRIMPRERARRVEERSIRFTRPGDSDAREVAVLLDSQASIEDGGARWHIALGERSMWSTRVSVTVAQGGAVVGPRGPAHGIVGMPHPDRDEPHEPFQISSDNSKLTRVTQRTDEDLAALRILDDEHPDQALIAAGAPWFMTLFGRDSLLTAWMTLIADPSLARGVLQTLARLQGRKVDPTAGEEPGKIMHEVRFADTESRSFSHGQLYYGSADATPLFVMVAAELQRFAPDLDLLNSLLPAINAAMEWIERYGDADGDGYVEYQRHGEVGLVNQGWKDSWDAIRHADGALADAPIALCEVQAYVYGAYLARAELATLLGEDDEHERCIHKAAELYRRFNEDFWNEEGQFYVLALDGQKRQVATRASNIGHALWTGIVRPDRAASVAETLLSDASFSGWGIRTLSTDTVAYNPVSYHNGSVWPHDTAICAWGLARYGFSEEAQRVIMAQVDVADAFDGRMPELFAGFDRAEFAVPAVYPSSCSPQAWASASPLLWLRTLLGVEPDAHRGRFWLRPMLPAGLHRLRVEGLMIAGRRITVDVENDRIALAGAGDLAVVPAARPVFDPVAASAAVASR
ncbi:glycogen debranching N-terminal domain-containing protein [Diaminobutyricimonas sp. LJ205]|uniref:amylo-alpha-1,6-glucosidase n=1 Tax=Diaminobutyricimonas sp. LJ205 TaxID=2683590 RepID=UPI0012F4C28E|nr:glycogen debranching N-terminal domain-containing protein [Diaminobutyricimonas sp. LJ205]